LNPIEFRVNTGYAIFSRDTTTLSHRFFFHALPMPTEKENPVGYGKTGPLGCFFENRKSTGEGDKKMITFCSFGPTDGHKPRKECRGT
jgi:hypothetical protein